MTDSDAKWQRRLERERAARKEAEYLLEAKSAELWALNQSLADRVAERTRELEDALARTEQASRAKDIFLATVSHEVRTPLNAILGFAQLLAMRRELLGDSARLVDNIETAGTALLHLMNAILDITRLESGDQDVEFMLFPSHVLLQGALGQVRSLATENDIEIIVNDARAGSIYGDVQLLVKAVVQLLTNAISFSPPQATVDISIGDDTDSAESFIRVRDRGMGIEDDRLGDLFKPFSRAHDRALTKAGGAGLGLAIVKGIVETLHGGRVLVSSEFGAGSEFSIRLPAPHLSGELDG